MSSPPRRRLTELQSDQASTPPRPLSSSDQRSAEETKPIGRINRSLRLLPRAPTSTTSMAEMGTQTDTKCVQSLCHDAEKKKTENQPGSGRRTSAWRHPAPHRLLTFSRRTSAWRHPGPQPWDWLSAYGATSQHLDLLPLFSQPPNSCRAPLTPLFSHDAANWFLPGAVAFGHGIRERKHRRSQLPGRFVFRMRTSDRREEGRSRPRSCDKVLSTGTIRAQCRREGMQSMQDATCDPARVAACNMQRNMQHAACDCSMHHTMQHATYDAARKHVMQRVMRQGVFEKLRRANTERYPYIAEECAGLAAGAGIVCCGMQCTMSAKQRNMRCNMQKNATRDATCDDSLQHAMKHMT